jgi:hypothetical protein
LANRADLSASPNLACAPAAVRWNSVHHATQAVRGRLDLRKHSGRIKFYPHPRRRHRPDAGSAALHNCNQRKSDAANEDPDDLARCCGNSGVYRIARTSRQRPGQLHRLLREVPQGRWTWRRTFRRVTRHQAAGLHRLRCMQKISDDTMFKVIKGGGASVGLPGDMPASGDRLSDPEISRPGGLTFAPFARRNSRRRAPLQRSTGAVARATFIDEQRRETVRQRPSVSSTLSDDRAVS